ncbi:MAG: CpaF family protein [Chloroflexi bacterium]|nr:CpaF family protein [Chloroflexota bacterium]
MSTTPPPNGGYAYAFDEDDAPILRQLAREIRTTIAQLEDAEAEPLGPTRLRQLIAQALEQHERRARTTTNIPRLVDAPAAAAALEAELFGAGPLQQFLDDPTIEEFSFTGPHFGWVWRTDGRKERIQQVVFDSDDELVAVIRRLLADAPNRRLDWSSPMVNAAIANGHRLNAALRGTSKLGGTSLTIRKFPRLFRHMDELVERDMLSARAGRFLLASVAAYTNILIAGGLGMGKTTLANVLLCSIPGNGRVVICEEEHELSAAGVLPDAVVLEARPPNLEGVGAIPLRALVTNALRMRAERLCVGEVRGPEALELVEAMTVGADGSISTIHGSTPHEALMRLGRHALRAEPNLTPELVAGEIASCVHLVVQLAREGDLRYVSSICETAGTEDGVIRLEELWRRERADQPLRWMGIRPRLLERIARWRVPYTFDEVLEREAR